MKADKSLFTHCLAFCLLLIALLLISIFFTEKEVLAKEMLCKYRIFSEIYYKNVKENFPPEMRRALEIGTGTGLQMILAGRVEDYRYDIQLTGHFNDFTLTVDRLTLCGFSRESFWELGKKDWSWGKGLVLAANYPLEEGIPYWGLENTAFLLPYSLIVGGALEDIPRGAAWIRLARIYPSFDWETCLACLLVDNAYHWEGGVDLSWDLLNGLSLHGAYKREFSQKKNKYLLGGTYMEDDKVLSFEYYYDDNHYLYGGLSKEPGLFGSWQWGIKEVLHLKDGGLVSIFNVQYVKNDVLIPELIVTNYTGKDYSLVGQNPLNWECTLRLKGHF